MCDELRKVILDDLENKMYEIVDTIITLNSQGYLVNKSKRTKLKIANILIHAFENIHIFDKRQRDNIEIIYNNSL